MIIRINKNYRITTIPHNYVLQKLYVPEEGENKGQEIWQNFGYCTSLSSLLRYYLRTNLPKTGITEFKQVCERIKELEKEINEAIDAIKDDLYEKHRIS